MHGCHRGVPCLLLDPSVPNSMIHYKEVPIKNSNFIDLPVDCHRNRVTGQFFEQLRTRHVEDLSELADLVWNFMCSKLYQTLSPNCLKIVKYSQHFRMWSQPAWSLTPRLGIFVRWERTIIMSQSLPFHVLGPPLTATPIWTRQCLCRW